MNALNSADFGRIEAALRESIETFPKRGNPKALRAWHRTLDKVERINKTGDYTVQASGLTLREHRKRFG